jgi:hypothetical protein
MNADCHPIPGDLKPNIMPFSPSYTGFTGLSFSSPFHILDVGQTLMNVLAAKFDEARNSAARLARAVIETPGVHSWVSRTGNLAAKLLFAE